MGYNQRTLIFFLAYINNPQYLENNINKFIDMGAVSNYNKLKL
jgi:hypothetical protein